MKTSRRVRIGWGLALAATLLAAWFAPDPQDTSVALVPRSAPAQSTTQEQVLKIRDRGDSENEAISVFGNAVWERQNVPMKNQPTELPTIQPEVPTAPSLPFRVMGRYEESGKSVVFLIQADQSWVVREGDTFAQTYKVERIASNAIHLRYLPLNEVQVLDLGAAP